MDAHENEMLGIPSLMNAVNLASHPASFRIDVLLYRALARRPIDYTTTCYALGTAGIPPAVSEDLYIRPVSTVVSPAASSRPIYFSVLNMRVSTVSAIIGLTACFASAAPIQPKEVQNREADPQWFGEFPS
jgi:hypothetical protein